MGSDTVAKECKAGGCTRKTKKPHGYCWQHEDMAPFDLQDCNCADPEHCNQPIPGKFCKAGHTL